MLHKDCDCCEQVPLDYYALKNELRTIKEDYFHLFEFIDANHFPRIRNSYKYIDYLNNILNNDKSSEENKQKASAEITRITSKGKLNGFTYDGRAYPTMKHIEELRTGFALFEERLNKLEKNMENNDAP